MAPGCHAAPHGGVRSSPGVFAGSWYRRIGSTVPPRPWPHARPSTSAAGPRGVSRQPAGGAFSHAPSIRPRSLRPTEYDRCRLPPDARERRAAASHEVRGSFSTIHLTSPLNPGLPLPVSSAFGVSHPLDGLLLVRLPGLVSCRSAHGVPALQSFPLVRSRCASRRPLPSCRFPSRVPCRPEGLMTTPTPTTRRDDPVREPRRHPFTAVAKRSTRDRLQGFAPRIESVAPPQLFRLRRARCSPGLRTSSGHPLVAACRRERRPASRLAPASVTGSKARRPTARVSWSSFAGSKARRPTARVHWSRHRREEDPKELSSCQPVPASAGRGPEGTRLDSTGAGVAGKRTRRNSTRTNRQRSTED